MSTTQDYQAAEQLLRRPARPGELVVGDKVRPQWIDGGARFWYAVSNGAGRRFVLVDPAAGTREPAFDHARLAAALAAASGQQVDPRGVAVRGHRARRERRGVRRVRRALALPPGRLRLRAGRVHAAGQPAGGAVTGREGRGVPAGTRPVGTLARSDGREWALTTDGEPDHQYGSGPDCTEQRHPAAQVRPAAPAARRGLVARLDDACWRTGPMSAASGRPTWWRPGPPTAARRCCAPSATPTPGTRTCRRPSWSCWTSPTGTVVRAQAEPLLMPQAVADHDQVGVVGGGRLGGVLPRASPATCARSPCTGWTRPPARSPPCSARPGPPGWSPTSGWPSRRSCGCWPTRCCGTRSATAGATCTGTTCAPARCSGRSPRAVGGAADPARRRGRAGGVLHRLRAGRRGPVPAHGVPGRSGRLRLRHGHRRRAGPRRHRAGQPGVLHRLRVHRRHPAGDHASATGPGGCWSSWSAPTSASSPPPAGRRRNGSASRRPTG